MSTRTNGAVTLSREEGEKLAEVVTDFVSQQGKEAELGEAERQQLLALVEKLTPAATNFRRLYYRQTIVLLALSFIISTAAFGAAAGALIGVLPGVWTSSTRFPAIGILLGTCVGILVAVFRSGDEIRQTKVA